MEGGSSVIPESVMESVKTTLVNVENLKTHLLQFLSLSDPDVLAEMPPLQRAQALFLLAKATTTLFTLRLRCSGIHPDDHPIRSELERLSLFQDKLDRFVDLSKAPLRPSTSLNTQAATRFIEHSLPDLTPEQRRSMKQISKGEGQRIKYLDNSVKKRKYQSSERPSVQAAAKEFLDKAARELVGGNEVPPEELYNTQLSQLQEMGFSDTQENIGALRATSGNVQAAVERLLGNSGSRISCFQI